MGTFYQSARAPWSMAPIARETTGTICARAIRAVHQANSRAEG
ncbi:hypothetical protein HMPREF1503_1460 [Olsenella uli MSTE5]|nr:hypothetical protein HMPREF1503_1460 [Olsenella uli MSTE5]